MPTSETRKLGLGNRESWCRCRPLELSLFSVHHATLWASYLVLTSAVYYLTIGYVLGDLRLRVRLCFIFPLITHFATLTTQQYLVCERTTELGSTLQNICFFYLCRPPSCSRKGIWSSLLVVIRLMMINDYNNKTGIIGANCAFWNGLHGGRVVGRGKAASASGSWKDGTNLLKAALLIALARAWEKALVWLYMNGVPQSPVILDYICSSKHKQKREQMFSHLTEI